MVSAASVGTALDKRYQMEIAAVNFSSNGQILTSALLPNFDDSAQANKDLIKRKLTARVSPMTRKTQEACDPSIHGLVAGPKSSHRSHSASNKKKLNVSSTAPSVPRGKQKLTEKRKSAATNVIIPAKSGNTSVNTNTFLNTQDEPVSKRPRTILPRTMQGKKLKFCMRKQYLICMLETIFLNIFILVFSLSLKRKLDH